MRLALFREALPETFIHQLLTADATNSLNFPRKGESDMSRFVEKKSRRYRTQFSMSKRLWERQQEAVALAAELGITVNLALDFEKWFSKLVEQVIDDLTKEKVKQETEKTGASNANV
jgi:uncharacterized membrane protein YgaE (UPF0421/DUF939 family)